MKTLSKTFMIVAVTLLCSVFFVGIGVGQTLAQLKVSKITFDEPKHDFGKVQQGVELTFLYKFKNDGDERLAIQNVRASCGCTGASIGDKKEFEKGEAGEIKVSFNTAGRVGAQSKTVMVQSNDPKNPIVVLSFTCEILASSPIAQETK
jgi:hypothetical protein